MDERTEYERMIDATQTLANSVFVYYSALMDSGFEKNIALYFALEYQKSILSRDKKQ
jgi:hypothetical protein